jgi:hypothetical protein
VFVSRREGVLKILLLFAFFALTSAARLCKSIFWKYFHRRRLIGIVGAISSAATARDHETMAKRSTVIGESARRRWVIDRRLKVIWPVDKRGDSRTQGNMSKATGRPARRERSLNALDDERAGFMSRYVINHFVKSKKKTYPTSKRN